MGAFGKGALDTAGRGEEDVSPQCTLGFLLESPGRLGMVDSHEPLQGNHV